MSLKEIIENYIIKHPEDAVEIDKEVSTDYEITATASLLERPAPLLIFRKIKNYEKFMLVSNVFSSRQRIFSYFNLNEDSFYDFWDNISRRNVNYEVKKDEAPVKEVIHTFSEVDLHKLPIVLHYPQDGGRYITSGIIVARDPENFKIVNLSFARIQLIGKNEIALSMHSRGHLWTYFQKSLMLKKDLPISVIIGAHPIYYLLAASRIQNEYSKIEGFINDYLTTGITNDLPVPANSEIILEGKVLWDKSYPEGPFTEYTGYISNRSTNNYALIEAMYMKDKPLYLEINPSNSKEHITLSSISKEPIILGTIRNFFQSVSSYRLEWPLKGVHYVLFGKILKPSPGEAMQLALLALGLDHYLKMVIISEGEQELTVFGLLSSMLCGYKHAVLQDVLCNRLDPSANPEGTSSKVVLIVKPHENYEILKGKNYVDISRCGRILHIGADEVPDAHINILVDSDIDPSDEDQVLWALATRFQPSTDIKIENNEKTTFDTRGKNFKTPKLPSEVIKNVRDLILRGKVPF